MAITPRASLRMASRMSSASLLAPTVSLPAQSSSSPESARDLAHHRKGTKNFQNPWPSFVDPGGFEIAAKIAWGLLTGKYKYPDKKLCTTAVRSPSFLATRHDGQFRATWLGHACFHVEFPSGLRVLFDPVLTVHCSTSTLVGPNRITKSPCAVADVPFVDACIISHCHYDHLSLEAVQELHRTQPQIHFFVPMGVKKWFTASGIDQVTELDWWAERDIRISLPSGDAASEGKTPAVIEATISCLPAQHMANRGLFDRWQTLWASWSVTSGGKSVYFAGDTGYRSVDASIPEVAATEWTPELHGKFPHCPAFRDIGKHRGPFDLGLIPIGAYSPRALMSGVHSNPFDAVNIFKDTQCKKALAMHWGTWVLTFEDVMEPPRLLRLALEKNGIAEEGVFDICDIGESREF